MIDARIELRVHDDTTMREYRELGSLAQYCIARIERDAGGAAEAWSIEIVSERRAEVRVRDAIGAVHASGSGVDAAAAAWNALCHVEQLLRETRASSPDRNVPQKTRRAG